MEESSKKEVDQEKIFAVPFALGEIKENISITTTSSNKISQQQEIINQAFKSHSEGKIQEAMQYYQDFINQGFEDHRVFTNYGAILTSLGQLKEAEKLTLIAIKIQPNFADAHYNLGNIQQDLGKLKEAELSQRRAITLKPDLTDAHLNLANILRNRGKLKEAEISTRKVIELKPNSTEAYCNLTTILIDLGKLEESILISKSTLKLKSINQGDKLRTLLQIAITNLLIGDFSETILNINQAKELINQGAHNSIKSTRNKKHIFNFTNFISSLYPELEKKDINHDLERIPHIGESHCLSFAHQTLSIVSKSRIIQPVLITGAKAWHFASEKNNKWKDSLKQQLKNHTYSNTILISFGEIDCRKDEGILNFSQKKNKDIWEVCESTINGYLNHMEITLSPIYSKRYYFGIPAPIKKKELNDELDIKRIKMIKIYNSILKNKVLSRGAYFIDVYTLTSKKNGENNNLFMCDNYHLAPKCLSMLFENYLYKPDF